jgi:hypothetical protein
MRITALALTLALPTLASGAAHAGSPVEAAFGNTVISTYPDGRTQRLWLEPDGGYTAKGRRGQDSSGLWRMKGNEVCLQQVRPFPAPIVYCTPAPADAKAVWTSKAVNGQPITLRVVQGR